MTQINRSDLYDVVVIGGGPAGLTAGLYLARARYRVLILEKDDFGGQITITDEVVNYPGVGRTSGRALTQTMRNQAKDFGAEFLSAEATGLDVNGDIKTVHTSRGDLKTFGILIATGASPRKLGFAGEAEYAGRGVAYCATCDGEFFTGREVLVVGGGFAAAEESVFLTKYASKVTVLVREPDFTCDAAVAAEAKNNPKIDVRYNVELKGVTAGQGGLREATILDRRTGETESWKPSDDGTFGVFVFAGYVPATELVRGVVELDDTPLSTELQGFIGEMVALSNGKLNSVAVDAAGVITAEDGSSAPTSLTVGEPLAVTLPDGAELPVYGSLDDSGRAQFDVSGVLPSARPVVRMCVPAENSDAGTLLFTGLAFHGVPSGHEFNSFVLGLYNAAGPGQPLDDDLKARAEAIDTPIDVMILVSLTCTMCPETVLAAQRIASLNPNVRAEAYDVAHFPELKDQYGAMSVPCIVINHPGGEQKVEFGKKSVPQMLTLLGA